MAHLCTRLNVEGPDDFEKLVRAHIPIDVRSEVGTVVYPFDETGNQSVSGAYYRGITLPNEAYGNHSVFMKICEGECEAHKNAVNLVSRAYLNIVENMFHRGRFRSMSSAGDSRDERYIEKIINDYLPKSFLKGSRNVRSRTFDYYNIMPEELFFIVYYDNKKKDVNCYPTDIDLLLRDRANGEMIAVELKGSRSFEKIQKAEKQLSLTRYLEEKYKTRVKPLLFCYEPKNDNSGQVFISRAFVE